MSKRFLFIVALMSQLCVADERDSGYVFSLACPEIGQNGTGSFTGANAAGLSISADNCVRVNPNSLMKLSLSDVTLPMGSNLLSPSGVYAMNSGKYHFVPPILDTDTNPIFTVDAACNVTSGDVNFLFVQIPPSNFATVKANYLAGWSSLTPTTTTMKAVYDRLGVEKWTGTDSLPIGTCTNGVWDVAGTTLYDATMYTGTDWGGLYKTGPGEATMFLPKAAITPLKLASRTYHGIRWRSGHNTTAVNVRVSSNWDGTVYVLKPYTNVETNALSTVIDTITVTGMNSPMNGAMVATVARSTGGTGKLICIANDGTAESAGTDGQVIACSGEDPTTNTNHYAAVFHHRPVPLDTGGTKGIFTGPVNDEDYISYPGGFHFGIRPSVAMSDDGSAIIVWEQNDGTRNRIFKAEYRDGIWSYPSSLTDAVSPANQNAAWPKVVMNANGEALIVWGASDNIFKAEFNGTSWTLPTTSDGIAPTGAPATWTGEVAMADNGDAVIAWAQCPGDCTIQYVYKSEKRSGTWVHPSGMADAISLTDFPDHTDYGATSPSVSMNDDGDTVISYSEVHWAAVPTPTMTAYVHVYEGSWAARRTLGSSLIPQGVQYTDAAISLNNDIVVVWEQQHSVSGYAEIFMAERRSGSWTGPADEDDSISPTGNPGDYGFNSAEVAMNDAGDTIIVYNFQDTQGITAMRLYKSEYRSGSWTHAATFGSYFFLNMDYRGLYETVITMNDDKAQIVWTGGDVDNYGYVYKSEHVSGSWTHPSSSADYFSRTGMYAAYAWAAMDNLGQSLVVWGAQPEGFMGTNQIYKSEYRR